MEQRFTLFTCIALTLSANATVHVVTCQNGTSHFLPVTVNATVGDTIHWTWVSGNHVVGVVNETDIPVGADTWNGLINTNQHTFDHVVAIPGTYHYVCHPDAPHNEDGYIVVSDATTGIQSAEPQNGSTLLYPNPFTDELTFESSSANGMLIYDALGVRVASLSLITGRKAVGADLGRLPEGIYFCSILRNGVVIETKRVVKR
jgi:plastocyanin